jgi:hypothetical protein
MQNPTMWRAVVAGALCLGFTASRSVRADSARVRGIADAVRDTSGPTFRVGTMVGVVDADSTSATALGLVVAGGHRFGRLAIESEAAMLQLEEQGPSSLDLGSSSRLGVIVRYDVVRVGSRLVGPNTMVAMFVEGGASQTWVHWRVAEANELPRIVPDDTRRVEGQGGFGLAVDHRIVSPAGLPYRVAWHLGWRFAAPPPPSEEAYACRGTCRIATPTRGRAVEGSVLFQSSLAFTW